MTAYPVNETSTAPAGSDTSAPPIREVVATEEELRTITGQPGEGAVRKDIGRLDRHSRAFIARSPFLLVASADANGRCDVSPRGDPPGFALVLDDHTVVLPERPGNKRGDTLSNVIANPEIGLLFIVPGMDETLRINGSAVVARDTWLRERMAERGKIPALALVVTVREAYFHCAKAFRRSDLWDPARFSQPGELPSLGQVIRDQLRLESVSAEQLDKGLEEDYRKNLY